MTTGQLIKEARKRTGMTQKQLAEKLGISYVNISQLENEQRAPKYDTIQRIAAALGVSVSSLLPDNISHIYTTALWEGYEGRQFEDKMYERYLQEQGYTFSKKEQRMIAAFSKMDDEGQEKAADYAEDILPRYRRQEPEKTPPDPQVGTDTTPPPTTPETPPEGE